MEASADIDSRMTLVTLSELVSNNG